MGKKHFTKGTWRVGWPDGSGHADESSGLPQGAYVTAGKPPDGDLPGVVVRGGNLDGLEVGVLSEEDAHLMAAAKDLYYIVKDLAVNKAISVRRIERVLKKAEAGLK